MNLIRLAQLAFVISGGLLQVCNCNKQDENVLPSVRKWTSKTENGTSLETSGIVYQNEERILPDKDTAVDVPDYTIQIGNYSWLQVALVLVVWGLIAGVSILFVLGQEFRKHFLDNSRQFKEADEADQVLNKLFPRNYGKY